VLEKEAGTVLNNPSSQAISLYHSSDSLLFQKIIGLENIYTRENYDTWTEILGEKDNDILKRDAALLAKDAEISRKDAEISAKTQEISRKEAKIVDLKRKTAADISGLKNELMIKSKQFDAGKFFIILHF
jgi:hypothetical protein